ncbi:MAG: TonB-dependent receptor [Saprospirales bacterium]|nr:TonB-dependent receptor [Saprospirales bacterium]
MRRPFFSFLLLLAFLWCQAQTPAVDTIAELPTALVLADRQELFGQGARQWTGELEALPVYMKSYGPGQLASLSLRGAGAAHTALIWNGFNLQNPMHGQVDFSLVPALLFPEIRVDLGANAALWGSGSIGGAVHLKNDMPASQSGLLLEEGFELGSFSQQAQFLALEWGGRQLSIQTRVFRIRQQNDFPFIGLSGLSMQQPHAAFRQLGGTQDLLFRKKDHQLDAHIWVQGAEREIPPTLLQSGSEATQADQSVRLAVHWGFSKNKWALHLRSAYLRDVIDYQDPAIALNDWSRSQVFIMEEEWHWAPRPHQLLAVGLHQTWLNGKTDYYEGNPFQMRQAAFASYRLESRNQKWVGTTSIRQEWSSGQLAPFSPALNGTWKPLSWLHARFQLSRHFRWPTMNDLYWTPGGNPDLQPEKGWGGELGLKGTGLLKRLPLELELSAYSRRIEDWIQWRPAGNFWSPQNLALVWSRGMESSFRTELPLGAVRLELIAAYSGVRATSQKKLSPNDDSVGKQLIYTPLHTLTGDVTARWNGFSLGWKQRYSGKVYTSPIIPTPCLPIGSRSCTWSIRLTKVAFLCCYSATYEISSTPLSRWSNTGLCPAEAGKWGSS